MASLYEISVEAQNDLFEIWQRIAVDSVDLANRIEDEFHALFASLVRMPGQGHVRKDLTTKAVLFFPLYSFLVVYQPEATPLHPGSSAWQTGRKASPSRPTLTTASSGRANNARIFTPVDFLHPRLPLGTPAEVKARPMVGEANP